MSLDQACLAFYVVRETSAKFGLHVGNMKFNIQSVEWKVYLWLCVILPVYFWYIICNKKYSLLIIIWKIYKKWSSLHSLGYRYFNTFKKIFSNVMCVFIYKQLIIFQNCLTFVFRICQEKELKTFPHFKCLRVCGQRNTVSWATCCRRATGWARLL